MNTRDVLRHIVDQLDWRGPNGKSMGHIVMTREQAEIVRTALERLIPWSNDGSPDSQGHGRDP